MEECALEIKELNAEIEQNEQQIEELEGKIEELRAVYEKFVDRVSECEVKTCPSFYFFSNKS